MVVDLKNRTLLVSADPPVRGDGSGNCRPATNKRLAAWFPGPTPVIRRSCL